MHKILFFFLISTLSSLAAGMDIGFLESKQFIKTNLNSDGTGIQYSLVDPSRNKEIKLTKKKKNCFLSTTQIQESLDKLDEILVDFPNEIINRFSKDLELHIYGSGFSEFNVGSEFLTIFKQYIQAQLPKKCISRRGFLKAEKQIGQT